MYVRKGSQALTLCRLLGTKFLRTSERYLGSSVTMNNKKAWDIPERDLVLRRSEKGSVVLDIAKVKREPFLKGLFQDKYDKEMLAFPEVLNKEQVDDLDHKLLSLGYRDETFQDDPAPETLKLGGVFGLEVPDEYGGLGYTMTEAARVLEAMASTSHFQTTLVHNFLVQALLQSGSDEQKRRLLPGLASGEVTAAFCCSEQTASSDLSGLRCTARPDGEVGSDQGHLLLNGTKVGVARARSADLLLVIANTQDRDHLGNQFDLLSALVVDKSAGGITYKSCDPGLGADLCDVEFKNTPVTADNVIGAVGSGHSVLLGVLNHIRSLYPAQLVGFLRPLVAMTTKHCLHRQAFKNHLSDFGLTKAAIASVNRDMYIMESLTYITTGLVDLTQEPDYVLEAAVCKVVSSELAQNIVDRCLRLLGDRGYYRREETGDTAERYLKETRAALRFTGSNELLRLFIALGGLQEATPMYAEEVTKMRNPMLFPVHVLKRLVGGMRNKARSSHTPLHLYGCLHPSLKVQADELEECVHRFADLTLEALERFGADLMNQQPVLTWLAENVSDIYVVTAVLARASRSYCIGLRDAETEIALATSAVQVASERMQRNAGYLDRAPFGSPDSPLIKAADIVLERGGYASSHSLQRTY
ncbi:complex I assembly factor ACAD9, mitochondrial-like isoform X2 [Amphibalanus amphitrite]|uniref:complex I assembly factor ACAD9, mitochondrial-like isoform X1 n=1 Tax=Amphibalanus amphitrite TaxID=1232801 RepID=UPI001C901E10|nr:complex I assembly factor ACAD9, mitochondrial-like isoform X1 [Amphibalanus amphitrite]XP_043237697.1 complex I assembly factor ACAD9, mitochondrial-like isoform X2 [Amphibalanus amphitrite]